MPAFDFVVFGETEWSDWHTLTEADPVVRHCHIPPEWPDDDFLRNSRRQSDAEIHVEVDE